MAIINTNPITLRDCGLELAQTMISAHDSHISNNAIDKVKVRAQVGFFLDVERMLASQTNALKVEGFGADKRILEFDYPTDDNDVFYYFDLKMKEHLLECFPEWEETKLILTTAPEE